MPPVAAGNVLVVCSASFGAGRTRIQRPIKWSCLLSSSSCCANCLQVWRDLALAYASQQQHADAEKCVQHVRQLDPDSAASYHVMGVVAASRRNDVAAKAAYKAALALDAAYAPALLSLGELRRWFGGRQEC